MDYEAKANLIASLETLIKDVEAGVVDTLVYVAMGRDLYSAEVIGQDQTVGSLQAAGLAALATINDVINDACDELLEKVKKNDDLYRGPTN